MSPQAMPLEQLDRRLEELRATVERVGGRLVGLDGDPTRQLLDGAALTGATAAAWAADRARIDGLWRDHAALAELLRQAGELRGSKGKLGESESSRLAQLLFGPAIPAPDDAEGNDPVAVPPPELLGRAQPAALDTADQVLTSMADAWASVSATVTRAATAWEQIAPRLTELEARLDAAGRDADAAGARLTNEMGPARRRLAEMRARTYSDPLSLEPAAVDPLAAEVARVCAVLETAAQANRDLGRIAADLDAGLDTAAGLLADAKAAAGEAEVKLARWHAPVGDLDRAGATLASLRDELAAAMEAGAGPDTTGRRLTLLQRRSAALHDEARTLAAACRGGLAARNELRGRLGAYRARAAAGGRGEDLDLDALYRQAEAELYRAPCDLQRAGELVARYQGATRASAAPEAR